MVSLSCSLFSPSNVYGVTRAHMERLTDGWRRRPPLYGPWAELFCFCLLWLTWTFPASSSHTTRNWMIRSGMDTTLRAIRYSGFLVNRELFSSVLTSSIIHDHTHPHTISSG